MRKVTMFREVKLLLNFPKKLNLDVWLEFVIFIYRLVNNTVKKKKKIIGGVNTL